jgi:hypothetical protein
MGDRGEPRAVVRNATCAWRASIPAARAAKLTPPLVQSSEMSLLVLSLSIAVASSVMIAQPRMNMAIGVAER